MLTEAEILLELMEGGEERMPEALAREILKIKVSEKTDSTVRELLTRNNASTITADEREQLERYLRMGQFIDLLRAKARLALPSLSNARGSDC